MAVRSPQAINQAFADGYNSGDVRQLLKLYEPGAILAPLPSQRAQGLAEIERSLRELLLLGGTMQSVNKYCIQCGNVALLQAQWTITTYKDGAPFVVSSRTAEVVRQQVDGSWLYAIDHAFANDDLIEEQE